MVSAVSSIGKNPISYEELEVVRRLQSLGLSPSGNLSIDRQRLQTAEIIKKQSTLATNSEQNLNRLEGTGKDFSTMLNNVQNLQPTDRIAENQNGLIQGAVPPVSQGAEIVPIEDAKKASFNNMVGATQLAELNKLKLGLIA